jgi:hypothetical protein
LPLSYFEARFSTSIGERRVLKSKAFPIQKIYVPTKRRQTLDVEKVRQIAESILPEGSGHAHYGASGWRASRPGGGASPAGSLSVFRRANGPGLLGAGPEALTRRSHLAARLRTTGVTP